MVRISQEGFGGLYTCSRGLESFMAFKLLVAPAHGDSDSRQLMKGFAPGFPRLDVWNVEHRVLSGENASPGWASMTHVR